MRTLEGNVNTERAGVRFDLDKNQRVKGRWKYPKQLANALGFDSGYAVVWEQKNESYGWKFKATVFLVKKVTSGVDSGDYEISVRKTRTMGIYSDSGRKLHEIPDTHTSNHIDTLSNFRDADEAAKKMANALPVQR